MMSRLTAMDPINVNATNRARRERPEAERLSFKAQGVTSFFLCNGCDHHLPSREEARRHRCWPCKKKRRAAYQREYRAFSARAKAQGNQCPVCERPYEFNGRPLNYRGPPVTDDGDLICTRCATLLRLVGDDEKTLFALVEYLSAANSPSLKRAMLPGGTH
jgi:hypothetical protein